MNLYSLDWIVNPVFFKHLSGCKITHTSWKANNQSGVNIDIIADASDHNKACKTRVHHGQRQVLTGLLLSELVEEQISDEGTGGGAENGNHHRMLRWLNVACKVIIAQALLVLDLKHGWGIEHQPSNVEEKGSDDSELTWVELVRFVQVLVV